MIFQTPSPRNLLWRIPNSVHMTCKPTPPMAAPSTGLLSGVFTFVSREFGSFVSTASGGSSQVCSIFCEGKHEFKTRFLQEVSEPGPSTLRAKNKKTGRRADPKVYSKAHKADRVKRKSKTQRVEEESYSHGSPERYRREPQISQPKKRRDKPSSQKDQDGASKASVRNLN